MPTLEEHDVVMLDLGANTECDARNLVQFAIMGAAYARIVTGSEKPRVRMLNIGTEETKGTGELQQAAQRLRAATGLALSFEGYVEADKINRGNVDVVVSDGFSGNIALKAIEGRRGSSPTCSRARSAARCARRSASSSRARRPSCCATTSTRTTTTGRCSSASNGVIVKSHGSANAAGVANAVAVAARLLEESLTERIAADLAELGETRLRENGSVGTAGPVGAAS
jgi:glycerol-3-phosphate acyltransferase PlsX